MLARTLLAAALALAAAAPAAADPILRVRTERGNAVTLAGRAWTWDDLRARREVDPGRFDLNHGRLGALLASEDLLVARRGLDPARFDHFHPYLGWLLDGLRRDPPGPPPGIPGPPAGPDAPPAVPPEIPAPGPPPAAIPEPPGMLLSAIGLAAVAGCLALRRAAACP